MNAPDSDAIVQAILERTSTNPVTGGQLALRFKIDIRVVQEVVRVARLSGAKIGGSMGAPYGYFKAETPAELEGTVAQLRARGGECFALADRLMDWPELKTQLTLSL